MTQEVILHKHRAISRYHTSHTLMAYSIVILIMFYKFIFSKLSLRTQVLTLKSFSQFVTQIIRFMWNYGYEQLNLGILIAIRKLCT